LVRPFRSSAHNATGLGLGQAAFLDDIIDLGNEPRFQKPVVGVWQTQIREHVLRSDRADGGLAKLISV
jgi:hypothetical protein